MNTLEVYDITIEIKRRLSNMYYRFSTLFKDHSEIHNFWACIANHEKGHSEALTLGKGCIMWNPSSLKHTMATVIQGHDIKELESIEEMLREYERRIKKERISLQDALDILLNIENTGIHNLYNRFINLSGFKIPQKPGNTNYSIYEHMKVIKLFTDKYYRGNLPSIRIDDYADKKPSSQPSAAGVVRGKIIEIVSDMSYGFLEGEDGQRYMFLPEDISEGEWNGAEVNRNVEFSVVGLPWGLRATQVCFKSY